MEPQPASGLAPALGHTLEVALLRLDPGLPAPSYAHPGDAGADLMTTVPVELAPGERTRPGAFVPTILQPEVRPAGDRASTRKSRPGSRARKRIATEGSGAAQQAAKPASAGRAGGRPEQGAPKQGQGRSRRRRGGRGRGAASSAS